MLQNKESPDKFDNSSPLSLMRMTGHMNLNIVQLIKIFIINQTVKCLNSHPKLLN